MLAEDILRRKGRETFTIGPNQTLKDAADVLSTHDIGALIVTGGNGEIVGILSERDLVRTLSKQGTGTPKRHVRQAMSEEVLTCTPQDEVKDLMEVITRRRVRHLPVVKDGQLDGMISIGDVLKTRIEEVETEQKVLRDRLLDC